jgi:hypothetical protein
MFAEGSGIAKQQKVGKIRKINQSRVGKTAFDLNSQGITQFLYFSVISTSIGSIGHH